MFSKIKNWYKTYKETDNLEPLFRYTFCFACIIIIIKSIFVPDTMSTSIIFSVVILGVVWIVEAIKSTRDEFKKILDASRK